VGVLAALLERERSGQGQVVDAAIVDGVNSMMTMFTASCRRASSLSNSDTNPLGGAAPFYRTYRCADGQKLRSGPWRARSIETSAPPLASAAPAPRFSRTRRLVRITGSPDAPLRPGETSLELGYIVGRFCPTLCYHIGGVRECKTCRASAPQHAKKKVRAS